MTKKDEFNIYGDPHPKDEFLENVKLAQKLRNHYLNKYLDQKKKRLKLYRNIKYKKKRMKGLKYLIETKPRQQTKNVVVNKDGTISKKT